MRLSVIYRPPELSLMDVETCEDLRDVLEEILRQLVGKVIETKF
jgi:hypothetical protein